MSTPFRLLALVLVALLWPDFAAAQSAKTPAALLLEWRPCSQQGLPPNCITPTNAGDIIMTFTPETGTGAPAGSAFFVGQTYTDTASNILYRAITAGNGAADWVIAAFQSPFPTQNFSASHSLVAADLNKTSYCTSNSGCTFTLPQAGATFPNGDIFCVGNASASGTLTLAATTSTIYDVPSLSVPPGVTGCLISDGTLNNANGTWGGNGFGQIFTNTANSFSATQTFAGGIGGYLATVGSQSGASCTLTGTGNAGCSSVNTGVGDCGQYIRFTSASAVTVTLANSLPVGCQVAIQQDGAGQVTLSAGSGATLNSAHSFTKTFGQNAVIGVTVKANAGGAAAIYTFTGDGA